MKRIHLLILLPFLCALVTTSRAEVMDLSGPWHLRLDPADEGLQADWARSAWTTGEVMMLPGTTDLAGFGYPLDRSTMTYPVPFPVTTRFPGVEEPVRADEHGYLVRRFLYVGPAWYEREIVIPNQWRDRSIVLRMERVMWQSDVWIDGRHMGSCDSLLAEHRYELGILSPGLHRLSIRVDNRLIHNISTVTHAYGPETQSRWNGILGDISLEALDDLSVRSLKVFPAADRRSVEMVLHIQNDRPDTEIGLVRVSLAGEADESAPVAALAEHVTCPSGSSLHRLTLPLDQPAMAWDEFQPALYRVRATIETSNGKTDAEEVTFGFRHVERVGKEIRINGRRVFLRGTLDCAVYPNTGHPPMTEDEWMRVLGVIRGYGFNHVRFHTWCPPEAAFEAADRLGIYLQPETAAWVDDWGTGTVTRPAGIGHDPEVVEFLRNELRRMSDAYGNHPSFVMCAIGNEFGMNSTDWELVNSMVEEIKDLDPQRLYTGCGARKHLSADDFWFTHNSGAGTRGIGPANTDWDFGRAAEVSPVPLIAHETGQRPVYPDYDSLLPKFQGPLLPLNIARFQRGLEASGMIGRLSDFVRASARFQYVQYKSEHEAMLRTAGYSGYQLLMLNDFTGQSEALVGILDPFWETKGVVNIEDVRMWNAPTVLLARFPKYVWRADEVFEAEVEVAHYGPSDFPVGQLNWDLRTASGKTLGKGTLETPVCENGGITDFGSVSMDLSGIRQAEELKLSVGYQGIGNEWNLWVYPSEPALSWPKDVLVAKEWDDAVHEHLLEGGNALLLVHGKKNRHSARTGFASVYWSAGWWGNRFSSLGIICDPAHPALAEFPNEGWSDWQWHDLLADAATIDLSDAPERLQPIVQPVPDFHYNTRLGQVFEGKVGRGFLLVCGYDLETDLENRPAARQFRRSVSDYISSDFFRPSQEIPVAWIETVFGASGLRRQGASVVKVDSEDLAHGNTAGNAIDGDPSTFWHTRWQPANDPMPHEMIIDLGRVRSMGGLRYLPRQDQANGRIAGATIYLGNDSDHWGKAVQEWRPESGSDWQTLNFSEPVEARYLRLVVTEEVNGQPFASIAEIEIIDGDR
jgi:hypothetical protein